LTVIDASVLVDAYTVFGPAGDDARTELAGLRALEVPAIFPCEVVSAIRARVNRGELSLARASAALEQLMSTRIATYPFEPFQSRVWELRDNYTAYDAWYVALAEWLDADLVTCDERLVRTTGARCRIRRPRRSTE
jgi:predicted nucleic acid-binding protein